MDLISMIVSMLIVATVIGVPLVVNTRQRRRGLDRRYGASPIAAVVALVSAAFVALVAAVVIETAWGIAMSAVSMLVSWIGLVAMLSRSVERREPVSTRFQPRAPLGRSGSRLETASHIAGILSLVVGVLSLLVSVIALAIA
ncbi:hypothetical protein AB0B28_00515 [Glycomyces sp. NPDC046736]|uniref:hypothetical protein n=1 Tax=Glycomyces sp. NPDC046736 TaxID=3155615 RepID=UPI0033F9328E